MQNVMPEMDDDKGTSIVIVNSEKGACFVKAFHNITNLEIVYSVPH